ncbi:AMP-binding protein [Xenorhabdus sp. SGI240]|uniref:AMP-binding protein n=1 Tax=Xenorhabdus sp. SGI240 TaxID=3158262 RepID=UPI0032B80014
MNNQSIFELTRSQQAIFQMGLFNLAGSQFYFGGIARFKGDIALEQLVRVADIIRNTLDVFRIGFMNKPQVETGIVGVEWCGIRHDGPQSEVGRVDFSHFPDPKKAFEHWAQRQLRMEEDLSLTPIRIFAVRFQTDQSGWFVKIHHAALDGMGSALLQHQLIKVLEQESASSATEQHDSFLFTILAEEEQNYERSRRINKDKAYWQHLFAENSSADARKIFSRYPIGDYRGLEMSSMRIKATITPYKNEILCRFKDRGESIFRLFFTAVAWIQMVVEDGNCALLQAPVVNRWSEEAKKAVSMAVAPVLLPVFRQTGQTAVDCYQQLKKHLQKAITHSRYAPATRWGELASADWKRVIPAFGVSYQTGEFQQEAMGAEVLLEHMQAVESLFASIHIHDRFEKGYYRLEADFRRIWSPEQCHAFLQTVLDCATDIALEITEQQSLTDENDEQRIHQSVTTPIGVHLLNAFEWHADSTLFKSETTFKTETASQAFTYRHGLQWIHRFSEQLHAMQPEHQPVLILGRRTPEIVLSYLTCLIKNITVVPVCPTTTPSERLSTIIRNSGASLCIYTEADRELAETLNLPSLRVSLQQQNAVQAQTETAWRAEVQSQPPSGHPAYILYTSGSTGEPKGVAISAIALANYALAAKTAYADETSFNAPLFTSFGFDLTQTAILVPVLSGGFIQTHEQDIRDNPELLLTLLADKSLTGVKCTPSHLALLIEQGIETDGRSPLTFIVGGENLPVSLVNNALNCLPSGSRIINEYGPTEATVGCCTYALSDNAGDLENSQNTAVAVMPIGTALGKAELSLRDSWGQKIPRGFQGEIWISGPILAEGYLNDPSQTAEKFVSGADEQQRWYRTGDLGVQDARGIFHCIGRIDDEFKVRGHRIHPLEIEKAVTDVLIQSGQSEDHNWQLKVLKLVINTSQGLAETASTVKTESIVLCSNYPLPYDSPEFQHKLKEKIAESWLPNLYCTVQPWPMNANGKVDIGRLTRAAEISYQSLTELPNKDSVDKKAHQETENYPLPDWLDEEFLRPIWPQSVDLTASFFELGGDSIKAIRLVALLAKKGVKLGMNSLLTSTALGLVLANACAESSVQTEILQQEDAPEQPDANWLRYLPAVRWYQQQCFKYGEQLQQGVVLEITSVLSAEQINAAMMAVKSRHKIFSLRANQDLSELYFSPSVQTAGNIGNYCRVLASDESLEDRRKQLQGEICLASRPSVHEVVYDPRVNKHFLILLCHHLICDVHSWIFLLDELDQALNPPMAETDTFAEIESEQGAFLWGKWLADKLSVENITDMSGLSQGNSAVQPAITSITLPLSISGADFRLLEQRKKAERSQLIAAILLEILAEGGLLPYKVNVLFENHGRLFTEAGMPAGWNLAMANAVGWFTGFQLLRFNVNSNQSLSFLQRLKSQQYKDKADWKKQLGLSSTAERALISINDIGSGLSDNDSKEWQHINLIQSLSGGFLHPDEKSVADFDILIHDRPATGSVLLELRLGIPEANTEDARNYLTQINDRLSEWCRSEEACAGQVRSLIPADFPFSQLSQSELDFIIHGASE